MFQAALIAVLCAITVCAVELKVDHVTVAGRNLATLQKAFDAAGIACEFGGKHTNNMTEMAIASLPDGSYLELIAAQTGADVAKHDWGRFIEKDAGVCAWAVSVPDIASEAKRLKSAGIEIKPVAGGRQRPDGVALKWTNAGVGPGPHGSYFPFLIQDDTPRERRVFPHGQPSVKGMGGVALVAIAVHDLADAVKKWRSAFGLPEPQMQTDPGLKAKLAWFSGTPVVLAAGDAGSWLADRVAQFGDAPFAVILHGRQAPRQARGDRSQWFGKSLVWFDSASLNGARVGVQLEH